MKFSRFSNERKITRSEAEFAEAQKESFKKLPNFDKDVIMLVLFSLYQAVLHRALFPKQIEKEKENDKRNAE